MASTSPGYGITIRVEGSPSLQPVALITSAITEAGLVIKWNYRIVVTKFNLLGL